MSSLLLRTLGPLEVLAGGVPVKVGGIKQRIVLAILALRANSVVSRDALIEAVWADKPPDRPTAVLQVYVANLRRALQPSPAEDRPVSRIVSHPAGYSLAVESEELDLLEFRRSIELGDLRACLLYTSPSPRDRS